MTGHRILQGASRRQLERATEALWDLRQTHLSEFSGRE